MSCSWEWIFDPEACEIFHSFDSQLLKKTVPWPRLFVFGAEEVSYSAAISSCAVAGQWLAALELFSELRSRCGSSLGVQAGAVLAAGGNLAHEMRLLFQKEEVKSLKQGLKQGLKCFKVPCPCDFF